MKKRYLVALIVALVAVAIGGSAAFFLFGTASDSGTKILYEVDGRLVKDAPGHPKGGWYFEYDQLGTMYTIPLWFSDASMCAWQDSAGRCKPSVFVNGRAAHLEGIDIGEGRVGVTKLTFSESPSETQ